MSATHNPTVNGRTPRRTLSFELDRFDRMIDGLDQGLKEAIADGVKESVGPAVGEAVRATLFELVTNPDVMAVLGGNLPEIIPASVPGSAVANGRRNLLQRFGDNVVEFGRWLAAKLRALGHGLTWPIHKLSELHVGGSKRPLLGALLIGVLVGCITGLGAPWLAGIVGGAGAMGATLGAQMIQWKRRAFAPAPAC